MNYTSALILHALAHGIDGAAAADLGNVTGISERLDADRYVYVSTEPCPVTDKGLRVSDAEAVGRRACAWYDFPAADQPFGVPPTCAFTAIARTGGGELELIEPIHYPGATP